MLYPLGLLFCLTGALGSTEAQQCSASALAAGAAQDPKLTSRRLPIGKCIFSEIIFVVIWGILFVFFSSAAAPVSRGPLVPWSFGPRSSGPLVLRAFPFYLLCLLVVCCLSALLLLCFSASLLVSSAFLLVGFTSLFPPSSFSSCSALILSALWFHPAPKH